MKFIRVRVWVDITKPLKRGFFLRRPGEEDLWVKFRYERLSDFCYSCGRVGHNFNECKNKDESKENPVYDGNLRAEISEPTKLVYPDSKKRSSRGSEDGGAMKSPAGVSLSGNLAFSDRVEDNLIGLGLNRTGVVEEASKEAVGLQVSICDIGLVGKRTKDVGTLSVDVDVPQELIPPAAILVSPSSKSANGLDTQSPTGSQTSGRLEYFVEEPDSPSSSQRASLESEDSQPLKKSNHAIREVDSALITPLPSSLVIYPSSFSPAYPVLSKPPKGRSVKGGEGLRHSLGRASAVVLGGRGDIGFEEALSDGDSQSGIVSRAPVAGPNQPRVQWGLALWWKDEVEIDVRGFQRSGIYYGETREEVCRRSRIEEFQQLLSDCELMDLEFKGPLYTWTNNQGGGANIRERLDGAVANVDWRILYPYAQVFHDLLLGLGQVETSVTRSMNISLTRPFSIEEIKEATFQLGSLKSPGPDGFPGMFYQRYWDLVGPDVCVAVKRFFNEGGLLREVNATNLKEIASGLFSGMKVNRSCPILSHIFFADDALFLKVEQRECALIKEILEKYGHAFGQLINFEKSGICFSANLCDTDKQIFCDFLNVNPIKGDSKYLGLSSFWGRSKAEAYTFLVEKAMRKMQGWKTQLISLGGKETLIKSVKGNPEDKGLNSVAWDKLSEAKEQGGMGFRNYRAFNEAMLARQGWRLVMNPQSYWARVLKGIYFPNTSFMHAARGSRASWAWLSLLHGREILKKGMRWQIQNGKNTDFWGDAWIPSLPGFKISSTKPPSSTIEKVSDAIDPRRGTWDKQKLEGEVSQEDLEAIRNIPLPVRDREDQLVWHYNSDGIYSVKSGYHIAHSQTLSKSKDNPESSFKPDKEE
ncbi:hypothetical protein RHSIM_Rhsim02G0110700 [Rhododendron simsii]|uniref:CCHC-type domain-containing protein n=1 Tax=Rhododendron simsii TaxID=118357 RepID=A0A834HE32_RHOSS|nr:hypothetical protein RHSIM_Rhsim02G0110700 [Rhododendron simsii]